MQVQKVNKLVDDAYIIIPARLDSKRFPNKLLAHLKGKPVLTHTIDLAKSVSTKVYVASADREILQLATQNKVHCIETKGNFTTGTDRIAYVLEKQQNIPSNAIIIGLQADEPLLPKQAIVQLVELLRKDEQIELATLSTPLLDQQDIDNHNVVKVVLNKANKAMYFSRSVVPYLRDTSDKINYLRHIGIYAWRKDSLLRFNKMAKTRLEQIESLEQLRWLEHGGEIHVSIYKGEVPHGIDTKQQLESIEKSSSSTSL